MKFKDLELNGIILSEKPAHDGTLPPHIDKVRVSLLDFTGTVLDTRVDDDALVEEDGSLGLHKDDHTHTKHCKDLRDQAWKLFQGKDREPEWQQFFVTHLFSPLQEAVKIQEQNTRQ